MSVIDLSPLQIRLEDLSASLKNIDTLESWHQVEQVSQAIANGLRVREHQVDNHARLGKSALPQALTALISLALHGSPTPPDAYLGPVYELLRVAANLCLDHDENRGYLLEAGVPQAIVSLLEGYAEKVPPPPAVSPLPLPIPHLRIVKTSIGVLLNACIGYDAVKFRLISLESALTIVKLSCSIYPVMSWCTLDALNDDIREEWALRSGISNWTWRTVSELKDTKEDAKDESESRQAVGVDILPWVTPTLSRFTPPYDPIGQSVAADDDFVGMLVQSDFEALDETCTLLEGTCLDIEDFRLALARGYCFPAEHAGVPCFKTMIHFIENGAYPSTWNHFSITQEDRARKQKRFDICKAALIKTVVEVAGEEKNEEVLWDDSVEGRPGGGFVHTMVKWIKEYVHDSDIKSGVELRDDLVICASLSLGNLARRETTSTALLSEPLSLAPYLMSPHIFSPSTDVKVKHGVLGLLKHVAQSAALSPIIHESLAGAKVVQRITESGIWDEGNDRMVATVQLNAIGVVKHLSNASVHHALDLVIPPEGADPDYKSGLERIMALADRSDQVPIKSEGIRVLVNVIRTLLLKRTGEVSQPADRATERRKKLAITKISTEPYAKALAWFLARSGKFPILVNEAVIGLNLLCSQQTRGNFVLDAILSPTPESAVGETPLSPMGSDLNSPTLANKPQPPVALHGLSMLANVLRNTDNLAVYPMEIRANVCTLLIHLSRNSSAPYKLSQVQHALRPILERLQREANHKEELVASSARKVLGVWQMD